MPDMKAVGNFPRWVRFAVREGTKRKNARLQAYISAAVGGIMTIMLLIQIMHPTATGAWRIFIYFLCANVLFTCALWIWLALRWVDRKGMWVQSG